MMRGPMRARRLLLAAALLASCRGVETSYRYPEDLRHPNYVKRSKSACEFARRADASQLPGAFDLLLDREEHIRELAHATIRSLSAGRRDFGYRAWLGEAVRAGIVARWRAWWEAGQPAGPAPAEAPTAGATSPDGAEEPRG